MFILHGYPKLFGGPEMWEQVGSAMQAIGIYFLPAAFGFLAAVTEFFGGLFLLLGLFFRPALSFLIIVMFVATITHIAKGDPFAMVSHSIEVGIVFIGLLFMGPGNYSLQDRLGNRRRRW
jgi:putative oxidoreductase